MKHSILRLLPILCILFTFPIFSQAQNTCKVLFSKLPSDKIESLNLAIFNEFGVTLSNAHLIKLDNLVNRGFSPKGASSRWFKSILRRLTVVNTLQKKEASAFLEREISDDQAKALRLARALGRTEAGKNPELFAFSENYTPDQIQRKDRILELAGFSLEERLALIGNKFVDDVLTNYTAENLYKDQDFQQPAQAQAMNKEVIREMNKEPIIDSENRKQSFEEQEVTEVYESVTRNPIVRLLRALKYDPNGRMGFCFGRAFVSHLEALRRGIAKNSVRKVVVVGRIKAVFGKTIWRYHIATAVRAKSGGWWVVDPFMGKAVTLEAWYESMHQHDLNGSLRLYATEGSRFGPDESLRYTKAEFMYEGFNNYFKDVLNYFHLRSLNTLPPKPLWTATFDWILSLLKLGF